MVTLDQQNNSYHIPDASWCGLVFPSKVNMWYGTMCCPSIHHLVSPLSLSSSSQNSDWWISNKWWLGNRQAWTFLCSGYSAHIQTAQWDTQQSGRIHHCSWTNQSGAASLCERPLLLYDINKLSWLQIYIESGLVWQTIYILRKVCKIICIDFYPCFVLHIALCCFLGLKEI